MSGARAYMGFNKAVHVKSQDQYYNPNAPLSWCWDFNVEPMVSLIGQRENDVFHVFKEYKLTEADIPEMCNRVTADYKNHVGLINIYGDATGKSRTVAAAGKSSILADYE